MNTTSLTERARALFEAQNSYPGPALAEHNRRILAFATELGALRGVAADADLLGAGCWLHDIGLLVPDRAEPSYQRRSWRFVAAHTERWGLEPERQQQLRWMLRYTHSLRPLPGLEPMADLIRRAVQVEHSGGLRRHGLQRTFCRQVFADHPRGDLSRILVDFARITLLEDGPGQLATLFWPRREY